MLQNAIILYNRLHSNFHSILAVKIQFAKVNYTMKCSASHHEHFINIFLCLSIGEIYIFFTQDTWLLFHVENKIKQLYIHKTLC